MEPVDEFVGFEKDRVLHVAADLDTDRAVGILHRRHPIDLLDPVVRRLVEDQAGNPTIVSEAGHHDGAGSALDIKFPVEEFRTEATGRHEDSIGHDRAERPGEFETTLRRSTARTASSITVPPASSVSGSVRRRVVAG